MALIKCSGCEKDVSTYDATCSCGAVIQSQISAGESASNGGLVKVVIGVAVIGAVAWFALRGPSEESKEQAYLVAQQELVRQNLRDPESAQFSDVFVQRSSTSQAACGYVNAKNGFGGYVGRRRFVSGSAGVVIESGEREAGMDILWSLQCK